MQENKQKSFVLYTNYAHQFDALSMEGRGRLITAIFAYVSTGEVPPNLPRSVNLVFIGIKDTLDRDMESYRERCRKNSENGKKGGRPRKHEADIAVEQTDTFSAQPEKAYNENENKNNIYNYTDNESDNDIQPYSALPAPPIDEEEKELLISKGIPLAYIQERSHRAAEHARKNRTTAYETLLTWWRTDRSKPPWNICPPPVRTAPSNDWNEVLEHKLKQLYGEG